VDQALIGFYESAVARVIGQPLPLNTRGRAGVSERRLREWFSEKLITPARTVVCIPG